MPNPSVDNSVLDFDVLSANSPNPTGAQSDTDDSQVADFFADLEATIEPGLIGSIAKPKPSTKQPVPGAEPSEEPEEDPQKELKLLKKRYADSSREAQRLAAENRELSEYRNYIPILKAMRQDPNMVQHLSSYLAKKDTPASIKDRLGLDEGFVFDPDSAMNDPDSDSAKVLSAVIDGRVQHQLQQTLQQQEQARELAARERYIQQQKEELKTKYKVGDEFISELDTWANDHELTVEDIMFLKVREERDRKIASDMARSMNKHRNKMANTNPTLASISSLPADKEEPSPEEALFKEISSQVNGMFPFQFDFKEKK
jgi:hypothetical protein